MCAEHAAVRGILENLPDDDVVTILDMGASPEPFSRGTLAPVQRLVLVTEPSYKSLEASRRLYDLGSQLGIGEIGIVANKVASTEYREAIAEFAERNEIPVWAVIPYDDIFTTADLKGASALDLDGATSPGVRELAALSERLVGHAPMASASP